jgi:ACS family D-galactonate transporter-like MFS transporter
MVQEALKSETIQNRKQAKPTRARYGILLLLFIGTAINYLDRTNVSVAASSIQKDLGLNSVTLGLIFSAFGWSYAFMQVPGGWILDRFGPKMVYAFSLCTWSIVTLFHGFARNFATLFGLRLGLGFFEAPAFPTNSRVVAAWFPQQERAIATGVYTAGEYVGLAFATPILFWLLSNYGWHSIFFITGMVGILFSIAWIKFYHDPKYSKHINKEEMDYIRNGGGLAEASSQKNKVNWKQVKQLLKYRQIWGISYTQFSVASTLYFFLTWFPTYLVQEKHMSFIKAGFMGSLPYIAACAGVLLAGFWSDHMVKRGLSLTIARKTPIIIGAFGACLIVLANFTQLPGLVILIMSIAFFAQGMAANGWVIISDIAPTNLVGMAGGIFNLAANISGIITPIVIGLIVNKTHSFTGALVFIAALALSGALSLLLVVGKIKRITLEDKLS